MVFSDTIGAMDRPAESKVDARALNGVSETALMTLNGRAYQAAHSNAIIDDPETIRPVESIAFDFDKFGRRGQEMALRSLAVDRCATTYLHEHPEATVVALAEGFQTIFWRLNSAMPDSRFNWLSVDLEPVMRLRERLLPTSPLITNLAQSALDSAGWQRSIPARASSSLTEGLLMYLQPRQAMDLIAESGSARDAFVQTLSRAPDTVQPVDASAGRADPDGAGNQRRARCADPNSRWGQPLVDTAVISRPMCTLSIPPRTSECGTNHQACHQYRLTTAS